MSQRESHEMQNTVVAQEQEQRRKSTSSSVTARDSPIITTTTRFSGFWPFIAFGIYASLTLFSWITLCKSTKKPLGSKYGYNADLFYIRDPKKLLAKHERRMKVAQIVQLITAILTVPITSFLCSVAALAYIHSGFLRKRLNLQQTIALADQGWINPGVVSSIFSVGSLPLYFAIGLTFIGIASQLLQQSFVHREMIEIHGPRYTWKINKEWAPDMDSMDRYNNWGRSELRHLLRVRNMLEFTTGTVDPNRWTKQDGKSFYAPLAANFNTGRIPEAQHIPRINSTLYYVNITQEEFPTECNKDLDSGFFAEYHFSGRYGFALETCMPQDSMDSPWKGTLDRQDVTEVLYLNVSIPYTDGVLWKLNASTILGYFELPGARNNNTIGPLLDKFSGDPETRYHLKRDDNDTTTFSTGVKSGLNPNPGPLAVLAYALFGEGSFIAKHTSDPARFLNGLTEDQTTNACVGDYPLGYLGRSSSCTTDFEFVDESGVMYMVQRWISRFTNEYAEADYITAMEPALNLINKYWMENVIQGSGARSKQISSSEGDPNAISTSKAKISKKGIVVVSVLMALHLSGLLVLVLYSTFRGTITSSMGDMLVRMGTAYADVLGPAGADKEWKAAAKTCPGFIGDERPEEEIGTLAFGAQAPIKWSKIYKSL